jgi:hypothetical protein
VRALERRIPEDPNGAAEISSLGEDAKGEAQGS